MLDTTIILLLTFRFSTSKIQRDIPMKKVCEIITLNDRLGPG
jgi:hypothetical protein